LGPGVNLIIILRSKLTAYSKAK